MNRTQTALSASKNRIFQPKLLAVAMATVVSQSAMASLSNDPLAQLGTRGLVEVAKLDDNRDLTGFDVAALPNDQFAVVWSEQESGVKERVVLQRFNRSGEAVGTPVVIYENVSNAAGEMPMQPAIAAGSNGDIVVGWPADKVYSCDDATSVMVYRLEEGSTAQKINLPDSLAGKTICGVDVAMDEDGDFAVSWTVKQANVDFDVQVQTFNTLGQPQSSSVIDVAESTAAGSRLAMQADGSFMLVWTEDGTTPRVMGRRYANIGGTAAGDAFRIDNSVDRSYQGQIQPSVAADPRGGYITVWGEHNNPIFGFSGSYIEFDVRGQSWAADGSARSELFFGQVEEKEGSATQGYDHPSVSADSDGNMLAAWSFDQVQQSSGFSGAESHRRATALNAEGKPLGDRSVAFGQVGKIGPVSSGWGAKVAVSDNAAALIWTEESTYFDSPQRLQAVFLNYPREANPPANSPAKSSSSSGGGSLGWVTFLMAGLLAFGRRFRSLK